jgi:AcrR family transcriptional regulator
MPTDTFYRLPESKREHVLNALRKEITRSTFEAFSINSVVRDCGISRGSFYQYFRSKEDIFLYFLADYQKSILAFASEKLRSNGGDLFDALSESFRFAVRMLCYKYSRDFRHNLFCNMWMYEILWQKGMYGEAVSGEIMDFLNAIDRSRLNLADEAELYTLVEICMTLCLKDAAGVFMADDHESEVNERFNRKLSLLRKAYQK